MVARMAATTAAISDLYTNPRHCNNSRDDVPAKLGARSDGKVAPRVEAPARLTAAPDRDEPVRATS